MKKWLSALLLVILLLQALPVEAFAGAGHVLTREELDEFALKSQLKCEAAQKAGKFKVTVKNKASGKAVKGLKVIIKVYTGKKAKKIVRKTNSKGQVSFSTKSLAKGKHKIVITVKKTSKYKKASAKSSVKIVKKAKNINDSLLMLC